MIQVDLHRFLIPGSPASQKGGWKTFFLTIGAAMLCLKFVHYLQKLSPKISLKLMVVMERLGPGFSNYTLPYKKSHKGMCYITSMTATFAIFAENKF